MKQFKKRVNKLLLEVIHQADKINIPISKNIDLNVDINKRAKTKFGACRKNIIANQEHFQIEVGSALSICDDIIVKEVLAHEILHTCYNCQNHGPLWKKYAKAMNDKYGYNISRVKKFSEYNIDNNIQYKYKIVCKKCGKIMYRQKHTKVIDNIQNYCCKCGGRLEVHKL